ncbi:nuclear transport factor 2 family protein [Niveispirillum sp. KHB5.9]|uniref:nuclear transport factor 2 family protein n=1 Tax=Niveispirillum sp. KHB5.9 TaxID=3400269 RepID=UPI003A87B9E7
MSMTPAGSDFAGVTALMADYFDGLYHSDAAHLGRIFHPLAVYACATEGRLTHLTMDAYLPMVAARASPASQGEVRRDEIVAITFAGPVTALVQARCAIGPKRFTDFLSLVKLDGQWRIIAKTFHFDLDAA